MRIPTQVPLTRLAQTVQRLRLQLLRLHQSLAPAPVVMVEIITSAWVAQSVAVAADLRIADALAEEPLPIDDLASKVGAEPDALSRLLRALIGRGIFKRLGDGRYALTPLADALRWNVSNSMAALACFIGSPQDREHWSHCVDAIRTGQSVLPMLHGIDGFTWLASEPELSDLFNQAMTNFSELAVDPVTAAYDFSTYRTIVDVGGGHGRLLAGILAGAPAASGVLFDLPHVVAGAGQLLRRHNVADRVTVASGSFFESVPEGGDLYVLKNIIHDWADDRALQILKTVRAAAGQSSKLVLVECVIPAHDRDSSAKWMDLGMLVDNTGRERTASEYRDLLQQSGFQMTRVVPTASPFNVVEARAA
ncbi:hydroxyneurosporene methyltransferase [Mycobacteriaceae bacterium 1482268.1]|nr:hydroxyneurosporene methyltransferase [Mycobacteriaceae bacterium 1482268.1]